MGNYTSGYYLPVNASAVEGPEYNYHPDYNQSNLHSDYTLFYLGIGLCCFLAILLILLNAYVGCCSPWRKYWSSKNTGNRLILPLWVNPPKDQETILV